MGSSSKSKNKGGDILVQGSIMAAAQIHCPPDWAVSTVFRSSELQEMLRWGITATHMIFICYAACFVQWCAAGSQ